MEKLTTLIFYKNTIAGLLEINKLLFGQLCTERNGQNTYGTGCFMLMNTE
jgi:glycerol kinase